MRFGGSPYEERRTTVRLLAYWERIRRGRAMPAESEITPADLEDLWEHCFIVRIDASGGQELHYMGPSLARALAEDMNVSGPILLENSADKAWTDDMRANPRPILLEGEIANAKGRPARYRQCLLPLGENGRLTAIFGAMRCKVF